MRVFIIALLFGMITGCATYGQEITDAKMNSIIEGQTSRADMMATFGKPMTTTSQSDGKAVNTWAYSHVGPLGTGRKVQALSVVFDDSGKVESYSITDM